MNTFLNTLKEETNYTYTENGALTHKSTLDPLYDLFAMGAAYRNRDDADCLCLFKAAYDVQPRMALKCLFYLRDILEGQGERRFFRICAQWLATYDTNTMRRNLIDIPFYGRWDDLYAFVGTPLEADVFIIMQNQLLLDIKSKTPSLLAKWLKSENASSEETRDLARKTRNAFHMTARQYRKTLSVLRKRINVLERLMSENKWDEIEFDKIPSRAGMIYRNAFAKHDIERPKSDKNVMTYEEFAKSADTKVNAKALYPYECVNAALVGDGWDSEVSSDPIQRAMANKYWDNLTDYFQNATFDGIAVVDTSGSMCGTTAMAPINVAVSMGLYCASNAKGPFANHFMTFSQKPELIEVNGIDFCDNVKKVMQSPWGLDTNIEAAFDLLLSTALSSGCKQEDIPANIIIISDMEFNYAITPFNSFSNVPMPIMEDIANKWAAHGLTMPHLVFWNVDARQNNIPMRDQDGITFVSGASPIIFDMIMSGKTSKDLMMEKLNSARYERIR